MSNSILINFIRKILHVTNQDDLTKTQLPFTDVSTFLTLGKKSTEAEEMMQRIAALSMLYVGVLFTAMTYHNKHSAANITTLSNVGFSCSTAFLASCVFTGNASHGGLERSWMHIGDMLTVSVIACLLFGRVTKTGESFRLTHGRQITTDCVTYIPLPTSITYRNRMVRKESFG